MSEIPDIVQIVSQAAAREAPSSTDLDEQPDLSIDLEESRIEFQLDCLYQEFKHLNDNHNLRLSYTGRIYGLVVAWLVCVVGCVAMAGFSAWGFRLSDTVLVAFITSTTVNVVGLFVLVAKWMYPSGREGESKSLESRAAEIRRKP